MLNIYIYIKLAVVAESSDSKKNGNVFSKLLKQGKLGTEVYTAYCLAQDICHYSAIIP